MIDRRTFLAGSAAAGLGMALAGRAPGRALGRRSAAAESGATASPGIGLQLYTVRAAMARDLPGTLRRVAELGYREVELAGAFGREPAELASLLREAGLEAPAMHTLLQPLATGLEGLLDVCESVGHRYLVLAFLLPAQRATLDHYRRLADDLNDWGGRCSERGVRLAYHNHDFEFAELEDRVPYNLLLQGTDPEHVGFELDLYWIAKGGFAPQTYFELHPGRFPLFHVKDMEWPPGDGFAEVGTGRIDFASVFEHLETAGAEHLFIEQDSIEGDVWPNLERSLDHVRSLLETR